MKNGEIPTASPPSAGDESLPDTDELRRLFLCAIAEDRIPKESIPAIVDRYVDVTASKSAIDRKNFWKLYAELVHWVRPATVFGLKVAESVDAEQRSDGNIQKKQRSIIKPPITSATIFMGGALAVVMVLQIYSLIGSSLLRDISSGNSSIEQIIIQEAQVRTSNNDLLEDQEPLKSIISQKETVGNRLVANYEMLDIWSFWFSSTVFGSIDVAKRAIAVEQLASLFLQAIALYLLPLFYGLLGASVFVLRRLHSELQHRNFSPTANNRYRLRYALGAVLGATAGLFFVPGASTGMPQDPAVLAVAAFVAGFAVEPVFSHLDAWVAALRKRTIPGKGTEQQAATTKARPSVDGIQV